MNIPSYFSVAPKRVRPLIVDDLHLRPLQYFETLLVR